MVVLTFHVPTSYIVCSLLCSTTGGGCLRMDAACRYYAGAVPVPSPQTPRYLHLHNSPSLRNIWHQEPLACNLQCGRPSRASRLGRRGVVGRATGGRAMASTNCEGLSGSPTPCCLLRRYWQCPGSRRVRTSRTWSCYDLASHRCLHSKSATVCTSMPWSDSDLTSKSMSCIALGCACKPTKNHLPLFPAIWYTMRTSKEEVGDFSCWIFMRNVQTGVTDLC
jgi:hypothetical protein